MAEWNVEPNATTYSIVIDRFVEAGNMERILRWLAEMQLRGLVPSVDTAQSVIALIASRGFPRLALDVATVFERSSIRRLDTAVWLNCLISSAEALYASIFLKI